MTRSPFRVTSSALVISIVAVVTAACGTTTPTASPSASPAATASVSASATSLASIPASPAPSAEPSIAVASSRPACTVATQDGLLPSDHLVDLAISSTSTQDLVTFMFAPQGAPTPAGAPRGTLEPAKPPFSFAGSGQEITLLGEHAVQVRFTGMVIADASGVGTFHGPTNARPQLPALREAIQYDASEGVVGWYIGYDGTGCVTLRRDGANVTVAIGHPEAPAG